MRTTVELASGDTLTALELQWELYDLARKYTAERGFEALGNEDVARRVLDRWETVLQGLESDPQSLASQLDWVAERHRLEWDDSRLAALDLQYHDLRPSKSLFARLAMERLTDDEEVARATVEPPATTRAYFRGRCLERFSSAIVAANWDSVLFDIGEDTLRRVPMMEPLRGTALHVDTLLEGCDTPAELLRRLGS